MKKYFNTIKYLRSIQIYYRIWYLMRLLFKRIFFIKYKLFIPKEAYPLKLNSLFVDVSLNQENNSFTFLNKTKKFNDIHWDYNKFGKLFVFIIFVNSFLLVSSNTISSNFLGRYFSTHGL